MSFEHGFDKIRNMGLSERLSRFVPEGLKTPIKPTTYSEFVDALTYVNVRRLVAVPGRKILLRKGSEIGEVGAHYEYNITFDGNGERGRRVNYYHPCVQKYLDNPDYNYIHGGKIKAERLIHDLAEAYALTTIVTADSKLQELQTIFPDCIMELRDADRTFTQDDFEELRREAQQRQIRPWDFDPKLSGINPSDS